MEALTAKQLVSRSIAVGLSLGAGIFGAYVLRSAYAITCGRRWYQAREIGIGMPIHHKERKMTSA